MFDSHTPDDDFLSCDNCAAFGQCDEHIDPYSDEFDYDDPFDVVMYDIDADPDDLYALIDMLSDTTRSWYARRRLNSLAAAGPLRALVADIIIDSLGRRWNPLEHPRDRFGRFISTGGFFRWHLGDKKWGRARVERIDSDGVIHARSFGNDSIPDGKLVRFKHEDAVKMVSIAEPVANLGDAPDLPGRNTDLDADIPEFPEASAAQKRIYNALADGNMPAEDIDRFYLSDQNLSPTDFVAELTGLQERGLVSIDRDGERPRVARLDLGEDYEIDAGEIPDVPEDEVPELEDSPALTKEQRDLLDFVAEIDRGEGDGVAFEELDEVAEEDIQALVEAGVVDEVDGRLHLVNPEQGPSDLDAPADPQEPGDEQEEDIVSEILDAAEGLDDPLAQEAFQHYAMQLAVPDEADAFPLPDGLAAGKRRNAEQAAMRWWDQRNGVEETEAPAEDEATGPKPQDVLNPRNQALADSLAEQWFQDDEFLDSDMGVEYRGALKRLFDAEDLEENGFEYDAKYERLRAERELRKIDVPQEDIDGWPEEVRAARSVGESVTETPAPEDAPEAPEDIPETPEEVVPEEVVPEDVPEEVVPEDVPEEPEVEPIAEEIEDLDAPEDTPPANPWDAYNEQLNNEGLAETYNERIDQELRLAEEHGIDLVNDEENGQITWNFMANMIGDDETTERLFNDSDGSVGTASALYMNDPDKYKAPTAEADVPEDAPAVPDAPEVDEEVVDATPGLSDDERELLSTIQNGGQARRSQRALEDSLIEAGLLEEDENGDTRLTDAGREALGDDSGVLEDVPEVEDVPEAPEIKDVASDDVFENAAPDDAPVDPVRTPVIPFGVWEPEEEAAARELSQAIEDFNDGKISASDIRTLVNSALADKTLSPPDVKDIFDVVREDREERGLPWRGVTSDDSAATVPTDGDGDEVGDDTTTGFASAPTLPDPANPNDPSPGFLRTGDQGGLNAGGFYDVLEDNGPLKAGDKVYIKNGRSPEHAQNEALANQLYKLANVPAPDLYLGDTGDRLVSKIVDDLSELDPYDPDSKSILDRVRSQFAVDAWLANWDGMTSGNTMVTPDSSPYRIDAGSAMEFRAQGTLKGAAFGDTVEEIDNLRDASRNYEAARVFGPMTDDQIKSSVEQLAQVDPSQIESVITSSGLPESDSLAAKMLARRSSLLQRFGVSDPYAQGNTAPSTPAPEDADDTVTSIAAFVPPTNTQISQAIKKKTTRQLKSLNDFNSRTNPHLEPSYTNGGELVLADGSVLDFDTFYHTGAGGEGKHGKVVEVLDQDKYPGWVRMEFPDGTDQVRHVLGTGKGGGGLRQSTEEELEDWERQTSVTGDKATDAVDATDYPMSDGSAPLAGTRVVFDVGGEDQFGTLLYFNPKWDNGGRAYIIPEGGGKIYERPVRNIRSQTPDEIDLDAAPTVPYQQQAARSQYLPAPKYTPEGKLISREGQPINIGDWMSQRSGGDNLVGEVIDFPDQNLYPGWVTLRFPDGEVRVRHVEGYTDINKARGAGGLRHAQAPNMSTWTRQRRVKGEEGEVLSYDFSGLETADGTEIQVGQEVFGTDRRGKPISGMLIRINPHLKRNGQVIPTGFVLQGNKEVAVDVAKITNTPPPAPPTPTPAPRPQPSVRTNLPSTPAPTPSNARVAPTPTVLPGTAQRTRPAPSPDATPAAYSPSKGRELTDDELVGLTIHNSRSSKRTNGYQYELAALYEAQDYDALPTVVDQTEFARLVQEEGYVPIVRSVHPGTDPTTNMKYDDAFRYGAYFAGYGIHGYGSYFAYGNNAVAESRQYGPLRIYAAVRPSDMKAIDKQKLVDMHKDEMRSLKAQLRAATPGSDEAKALDRKIILYYDIGQYATAKGYDAIIVPEGNSHYDLTPADDEMKKRGYMVLLNRSASIVSDTHFEDWSDIFNNGFPGVLAPPVPAVNADPVDAGDALAVATPGVV
jgi:hypothetical protein